MEGQTRRIQACPQYKRRALFRRHIVRGFAEKYVSNERKHAANIPRDTRKNMQKFRDYQAHALIIVLLKGARELKPVRCSRLRTDGLEPATRDHTKEVMYVTNEGHIEDNRVTGGIVQPLCPHLLYLCVFQLIYFLITINGQRLCSTVAHSKGVNRHVDYPSFIYGSFTDIENIAFKQDFNHNAVLH